jgi:hypothetical protein
MAKQKQGVVTPSRRTITEDARETLVRLRRPNQTISMVLVALTDGIELEIRVDGSLRRRLRFLRDTEARKHTDRLVARLLARGFERGTEVQ